MEIDGDTPASHFHRELGKLMLDICGVSREGSKLERAIEEIPAIREEFWSKLKVGGDVVPFSRIGKRTVDSKTGETTYTYYGVTLHEGPNVVALTRFLASLSQRSRFVWVSVTIQLLADSITELFVLGEQLAGCFALRRRKFVSEPLVELVPLVRVLTVRVDAVLHCSLEVGESCSGRTTQC